MKPRSDKSLKQYLIQFMALLIGVCYLANPLHEQIGTVFHEIVHLLEAPQSVVSHHSHAPHHTDDTHQDGQHTLAVTDHEHSLLALFDSFFDASDEQHPDDDSLLTFSTCDKHLQVREHPMMRTFLSELSQSTIGEALRTKIGHGTVLDEPPRTFPPSV